MRFITFEYFKASLLNLKKLLSLKADKSEVEKKANKSDVNKEKLSKNKKIETMLLHQLTDLYLQEL